MNLYSFFIKSINKSNEISFDNKSYSYQEFFNLIEKVSSFISKVKKKKILILSENQLYIGILFFVCAKHGKVLIPLNDSLSKNQIIDNIKITKPDLIIHTRNSKPFFSLKRIPSIAIEDLLEKNVFNDIKKKKLSSTKNFIKKDFIITYSSGTTSQPKPILFTQNIKLLRYKHIRKLYRVRPSDNILSTSPLDHSMGQRLFFLATLMGANYYYVSGFNSKKICDLVKKKKISFTILPSNYINLLKTKLINRKIRINKIVSAASGISLFDKNLLKKNKINFNEMYGASEIGTVTSLSNQDSLKKTASVGKVLKDSKIIIVNKKSKKVENFTIGEIACKTKLSFKKYFNNKVLTNKSKKNGYFLTGDLGYLDNQNYLYFVSRKKELIISSGINIYPSDIEKVINSHSNIKDCAVIGLNDKFFGEATFAVCVIKKKKLSFESQLRDFLSKRLATYQLPLGYDFIDSIPKNYMGKILKKDLKKKYEKKKLDLSSNIRRFLN
jgi:long-chain acyl-CoA synthetase